MFVLVWIFAAVTILQIMIWSIFPARLVWWGQPRAIPAEEKTYPKVSVVICARNESENLKKCLPEILDQQYDAEWEVLVVDDDSEDGTEDVLKELSAHFPRLRVLKISPKIYAGKKHALTKGIEAAHFDWIILTDADCRPASREWLDTMMLNTRQPAVILGYAPMNAGQGWLNTWARFETLYTALQYLSTAGTGWPFMGVGRNMAWHRSFFLQTSGFAAHEHIAGGDDDLFVNAVAHRHNTMICTSDKAFVYSSAKSTLTDWISQKRRHLNAGLSYKTWHNLVLGGVAFTHAVHYGLGAILLFAAPGYWPVIVVGYVLRLMAVWPVITKACTMFQEKGIALYVPVLDGFMALWAGGLAPILLLTGNKKARWK